jgi:hypothetical protein
MKRHPYIIPLFTLAILLFAAFPAAAEPPAKGKTGSAARTKSRGKARKGGGRARASRAKKGSRGRKKPAARKEEERGAADERVEGDVAGGEASGQAEVGTVAGALVGESTEDQASTGGGMRHSRHMEFDARLVRGETAGSGAVVLFDRGDRRLPRLTRLRDSFLHATVEPVLGKQKAGEPDSPPPKKENKKRRKGKKPEAERATAGENGSGE